MNRIRALVLAWRRRFRLDALSRPRQVALAGASALLVLTICGTLLAVQFLPGSAPTTVRRASPTGTATSTATATLTPRPTATHTPKPVHQVKVVPTTPPPPPVPTAPPATPTVTYCTPTPVPTSTSAATPTSTAAAPTATATAIPAGTTAPAAAAHRAACTPCPVYLGNNPSQSTLRAALDAAADTYHLPHHLVEAVAWQESRWHEDVTSCDGGIGLMQIQYYNVDWLNQVSVPECGLTATSNNAYTAQGNANLGAKYLAYLACFYSYWGGRAGASLASPAAYTVDWYYLNHQPPLRYPDTTNANGSANPNSLCAAVYNSPSAPQYPDMPSTTAQPWPCPYSATAGDTTLLDITLSAYNEGPGYTDTCGICNPWYVSGVEGFIPEFYTGALPTAA